MIRLFLAPLFAIFLSVPADADDAYEDLLARLATANSRAEAQQLSNEIWQVWLTAPNPAAQEVLDSALVRRQAHDFLGAIQHLNRLVAEYPDYAEGWNQRATMYYLIGDFEASLRDVDEVLAREPRHFGALAGKSVILFNQGKVGLAQIAVKEALKYHPYLNEGAILKSNPGTDL